MTHDALVGWTRETPADGIVVWQPRRAFRYGSEAFWLVGFALEGGVPATALDLGTGSGIAALLLGARGVATRGVDVRPEWGPGWARSLADSRLAAPVRLDVADVRDVTGAVDLVVSNPPYFRAGTGPSAPAEWKAAARTEGDATLADFVATAIRLGRRACFVVPVERADEIAPPGWAITRRVRVGRRRTLVEITHGGAGRADEEAVEERGPRPARWYDLATHSRGPS